jgi:hypothetical protein
MQSASSPAGTLFVPDSIHNGLRDRLVSSWDRFEASAIVWVAGRDENAFGDEAPLTFVIVIDWPSRNQPGDRFIPVEDQHLFAVFDELNVGTDLGSPHKPTLS